MAGLVLFAQSLYEQGTLTVTSEAAGFPATRLYDRDRGPRWKATSTAQQDLNLDLGSGNDKQATAWALVNHNLAVTVEIYKSANGSTYTLVDSAAPTGVDPFYRAFGGAHTERYWRVRIPAGAAAAEIGELVLGVPQVLTRAPSYSRVTDGVRGNVQRDESPAGYVWKLKRGAARARLVYGWEHLLDAEKAALQGAFSDTSEGAKALLVEDLAAVRRWMEFLRADLDLVNIANGRHSTEIELLEAL